MTTKDQKQELLGTIYSPCYMLGRGFDIFGEYSLLHGHSAKAQLIDIDGMTTRKVKFLGNEENVPGRMNLVEQTSSHIIEDVVETRDDFQSKFAFNAQLEASYGCFSGQFSYAYANESQSSSAFKYAFKSVYNNYGSLTMDDLTENVVKADIRNRMANLHTQQDYNMFFKEIGTHYVNSIDLGANLEMYTSVKTDSSLTKTQVDTCFSAHYKGLFFSTSGSIGISDKKTWESYSSNSRTSIKGSGGDITFLARLTEADPFKPSGAAFEQWLESTKKHPVSTSFSLKGLWTLISDPNKSRAMEAAFKVYAKSFRVSLAFESIEAMTRLNVNAVNIPEPQRPAGNEGYQGWRLTFLNRRNPSQVIHDKYYGHNPQDWQSTAPKMYQSMFNDIKSKDLNSDEYIMLASTYGPVHGLACPSPDMYNFLVNAGGGKLLDTFENIPRFSANPEGIVRYSLLGIPRTGKASGIEAYTHMDRHVSADTSIKAFLYRAALDGVYSIGRDERLFLKREEAEQHEAAQNS